MEKLITFHGNFGLKTDYLALRHKEIHQGNAYGEGGFARRSAVDHFADSCIDYEKDLGIPYALQHVEYALYRTMSAGVAENWPVRFAEAIPVGANLSGLWAEYAQFLLLDSDSGIVVCADSRKQIDSIERVAMLCREASTDMRQWWLAAVGAYSAIGNSDAGAWAASAAAAIAFTSGFVNFKLAGDRAGMLPAPVFNARQSGSAVICTAAALSRLPVDADWTVAEMCVDKIAARFVGLLSSA